MAEVVATARGYYGGILRDPGESFNANGKASWFVPVGAAAANPVSAPAAPVIEDGLSDMTVRDLRDMAREQGITLSGGVSSKTSIIDAIRAGQSARSPTDAAPTAAPFADAPEPVRVQNEVNDLTGATLPDWDQS